MTKKKIITIALASAAMIMGGTAIAQQGGERGADMTRAEAQTKAAERFTKMDVNSDGQLDSADREAKMRERFDETDASGNGEVSFAEYVAAREARSETREERRAARTAESGERGERGAGRGGERGERGERGGRRGGGGMGERMMETADTDQNGAISEAEFTDAAMARFDNADANSDGTITRDERRAMRGGERGGEGGGERGGERRGGERPERAAPPAS